MSTPWPISVPICRPTARAARPIRPPLGSDKLPRTPRTAASAEFRIASRSLVPRRRLSLCQFHQRMASSALLRFALLRWFKRRSLGTGPGLSLRFCVSHSRYSQPMRADQEDAKHCGVICGSQMPRLRARLSLWTTSSPAAAQYWHPMMSSQQLGGRRLQRSSAGTLFRIRCYPHSERTRRKLIPRRRQSRFR